MLLGEKALAPCIAASTSLAGPFILPRMVIGFDVEPDEDVNMTDGGSCLPPPSRTSPMLNSDLAGIVQARSVKRLQIFEKEEKWDKGGIWHITNIEMTACSDEKF